MACEDPRVRWLDRRQARVAILTRGKQFTAGIDLALLGAIRAEINDACDGRAREKLRRLILDLQDTLTAIERCRKPVIAAVHGACIGGGVDLVTACDFACAADAVFSVRGRRRLTATWARCSACGRGRRHGARLAYTDRNVDAARRGIASSAGAGHAEADAGARAPPKSPRKPCRCARRR
jgi:enoyl-CoA hydratase